MKWDEVTPAKIIGGQGEEDFKQMLKSARPFMKFGIPLVILLWLLSGIYIVGPGEVGVVRQFGRFVAQTSPGLHYRLPWPIQAVDVVNVAEVRRAEVGFRMIERPGRPAVHRRVLEEAMMLTGDKNIADVQILVHYQVKDPVKYLFRARDPARALRINTEIALRSVIGRFKIDHAMTVGRPEVETGVWEFLQYLLDEHLTGLGVVRVELQAVDPPDEVRDAFYEVVRAKADRERVIREAEGYALDIVPRARGEAAAIVEEATAYKEEKILLARGEAARFLSILEEYKMAPEITRQRLFLEAMETVLAGTRKFIIDPEVGGDNLIQLLPLTEVELGRDKK